MTQAIVTGIDNTDVDEMLDGKGYILAMHGEFQVGSGFMMTLMTEDNMSTLRGVIENEYPDNLDDFDVAMDQMHKGFPTGEFVIGDTYVIIGTKTADIRPVMEAYEEGRVNPS